MSLYVCRYVSLKKLYGMFLIVGDRGMSGVWNSSGTQHVWHKANHRSENTLWHHKNRMRRKLRR